MPPRRIKSDARVRFGKFPSIRAALELLTDKDESPAHTGNR